MINVVIPIIDNLEEYQKSIDNIALRENLNLILGVSEEFIDKINKPNGAVLRIFRKGSKKEEIINSLKSSIVPGRLLVCRRPFTKKEFDNFVNCNAEISYIEKRPKNSLLAWLKTKLGMFIKLMFGVKYFDGDISLIGFDENLCEVLQNVSSLSYSTRVDRYKGVEQQTFKGELGQVKLDLNKMANIRLLIYAILILVIPIVITVLVAVFTKVTFVIGMILFCIDVLGVAGLVILLCSAYLNLCTGSRYFSDAVEL